MSLEEKQAAALRQRRRAFLDEVATIKKRQGGITKSQEQILEGVYELEPIPDWRTEARLAMQLGLDSLAVTAWFKSRRKKQKRQNIRYWYTVIVGVFFVVGVMFYFHELAGLSDMLQKRRLSAAPNKKFFTRSGMPRPYRVKPPVRRGSSRRRTRRRTRTKTPAAEPAGLRQRTPRQKPSPRLRRGVRRRRRRWCGTRSRRTSRRWRVDDGTSDARSRRVDVDV